MKILAFIVLALSFALRGAETFEDKLKKMSDEEALHWAASAIVYITDTNAELATLPKDVYPPYKEKLIADLPRAKSEYATIKAKRHFTDEQIADFRKERGPWTRPELKERERTAPEREAARERAAKEASAAAAAESKRKFDAMTPEEQHALCLKGARQMVLQDELMIVGENIPRARQQPRRNPVLDNYFKLGHLTFQEVYGDLMERLKEALVKHDTTTAAHLNISIEAYRDRIADERAKAMADAVEVQKLREAAQAVRDGK